MDRLAALTKLAGAMKVEMKNKQTYSCFLSLSMRVELSMFIKQGMLT